MARDDSEGLQVAFNQGGLHPIIHQNAPLYSVVQDESQFGEHKEPEIATQEPNAKRRICGMRPVVFFVTAAVVILIVLAGAIGGGVGGGIASQSRSDDGGGTSAAARPSSTSLSTASITTSVSATTSSIDAAVTTIIPRGKEFFASPDNIAGLTYPIDRETTGKTRFVLQTNNNFVVYDNSSGGKWTSVWSSQDHGGHVASGDDECVPDDTNGTHCKISFAHDGNLVNYVNGKPAWESATANHGAKSYMLSSKSPWISILAENGSAIWTTDEPIIPHDVS